MNASSSNPQLAIIVKGYPRLSETFIAQELRGLERAGLDFIIISLRHPTDQQLHPVHREIKAQVFYLPEYLHQEPLRVLKGWWQSRRKAGYSQALRQFLKDWIRDPSSNRGRRFGQALVLAAELPPAIRHLHAHFMHTPASVTFYAAKIRQSPWSCSAHAKDIWTSPEWDLAQKLSFARWTVTCTKVGQARLEAVGRGRHQVHLSYHGIDLCRFAEPATGKDKSARPLVAPRIELLTVCRAVEKKGLDVLLEALALLPNEPDWHWSHFGGGELIPALKKKSQTLGLDDKISWHGPHPHDVILAAYRQSDIFVLPCKVARDGDQDGLPNVLMEAQSQGLAVVSSDLSAVPEFVTHDHNGMLVEPGNAEQLAGALETLIRSPNRRREMGQAGQAIIQDQFSNAASIEKLLDLFGSTGIGPRAQ